MQKTLMTEYSDSELLELFRNGAEGSNNRHYAFNLISRKYQQRLYHHIRRMVIDHDDTNDILQNTLIKCWQHLDNFREDSQLFTWLYRIATNECLAHLRQKKKRFALPLVNVEQHLLNKLKLDSTINADKLEYRLQQAIIKLPEKQRLVFNLRYYDEMPYTEMSEVLGTSVGALKASYHHAVQKVEKYLTAH